MSQTFPEPERDATAPAQAPVSLSNRPGWQTTAGQQLDQGLQGMVKWFYTAGSQIFGLLTLTSVILTLVLILIGFGGNPYGDKAVLIAGLAVAIALPFNLVGLWLAQYHKDASQATPAKKQLIDSTAQIALIVGTIFTLVSLSAALWRISWVATILFLVVSIICLWLSLRVSRQKA